MFGKKSKNPSYKKPKYTPAQAKRTRQKYPKNPDASYKVSRVRVPEERQDSLFSALVDWLLKRNHNRRSGGRG